MAALTKEKNIELIGDAQLYSFPVANGETIYGGTFAVIDDDGYLRNLNSTYAPQARIICLVADESANADGPAATTAAGSISGSLEEKSDNAGDKTVRQVYLKGTFKGNFTSITQADVGQPVFASNNNDIDEAQNSAVCVGTLLVYISATVGYFMLNEKFNSGGTVFYKQAISASSGNAGLFSILNPAGSTIMIEKIILDIATASSVAMTTDIGISSTASGSSDTLIDGASLATATTLDNTVDGGTNGQGARKVAAGEYITGTASGAASTTSLAGEISLYYRYYE